MTPEKPMPTPSILTGRGRDEIANVAAKAVAKLEAEPASHARTIEALRADNNRLRDLLALADEAFMNRHGCFPLDRTDENRVFWNDALSAIRKVTGEVYEDRKEAALRALSPTPNQEKPEKDD